MSGADGGSVVSRAQPAVRWRVLAWAVIAALLAMAVIQYSMREDRLSAPPDFDDVMYMRYAAARVNELYANGIGACAAGWVRETPHSPWSCALAFVSFLMFGMREWAPYAASALLVVGFLGLMDWVMGRQRFAVKVLTALYLCTIPTMALAVSNFKPDVAWGLATATVAMACVLRPVVGASTRYLLLLGALCGLTLLVKPTTTPGALALLGLCGAAGTVKDWALARRRPNVVGALRAWGLVLLATVVVAGPFYCANWAYFWYYIRTTLFGEYSSTWYVEGGWLAQVLYFINGRGGRANLGRHAYLIPVVWLAGLAVVAARRDFATLLRLMMLVGMTVCFYLMPTVNPAKNPFLASPFFAMVIAVTAYLIGYLARVAGDRKGGVRATVVMLVALVVGGAFLFNWPGAYQVRPAAERADSARLHRAVLDALDAQAAPFTQLVTVTATGPVREITLAWYATLGRRPFTFERPYSSKVSDYVAYAERSDFVLAQEDQVAGCVPVMPNEQGHVQSQVLDMMRHRDDFRQLAEFTAADGKKLVLFQRTRWASGVMSGVRAMEGFGPEEGPYPKLDPPLPRLCWGMGRESRLVLTPQWNGEAATLRVECRMTDRAQGVRVVSGGVVLGTHRFERPWVLETFEVAVPRAEAGQELILEYEGRGAPRPWSSAEKSAMYTKVELVPATGG